MKFTPELNSSPSVQYLNSFVQVTVSCQQNGTIAISSKFPIVNELDQQGLEVNFVVV